MSLSKLFRVVGLSMIVSMSAMSAIADPPAPQPCTCEYCSHTAPTKNCIFFDGTTTTCGYFLAVTTCVAN